MAVNEDYLSYVLEQLTTFGDVTPKKMFGGVGLFHNGLMIGKVGGDVFRLKVDEQNQGDYEAKGMKPFYSETKKKGMPYWEVPVDVLEDKEQLKAWTHKSYEAALKSKK